jgi:hypothetical protein
MLPPIKKPNTNTYKKIYFNEIKYYTYLNCYTVKHLWEKTHIHNTDRKDKKNKERQRHRDRDIFTERLMMIR